MKFLILFSPFLLFWGFLVFTQVDGGESTNCVHCGQKMSPDEQQDQFGHDEASASNKAKYSHAKEGMDIEENEGYMRRFAGKVVIITGSSSGIGQEAAVQFAKEGATVVIHGQTPQKLEETEKMILAAGIDSKKVLKVTGSLEDPQFPAQLINETIKAYGKIDVLINNAGVGGRPDIITDIFNLENLDFIYKVNLRSIVDLSMLALPHLRATNGNILNIGSVRSVRIVPDKMYYAIMKSALDHWTRGFAQFAAETDHKVRVNSLNPGHIDTPIHQHNKKKEGFLQKYIAGTLLGRFGHTSEIAKTMKFLCSDEASYITGTILFVDGGVSVKFTGL